LLFLLNDEKQVFETFEVTAIELANCGTWNIPSPSKSVGDNGVPTLLQKARYCRRSSQVGLYRKAVRYISLKAHAVICKAKPFIALRSLSRRVVPIAL
jgi:hypothetical protein